MAQTGYTPIKIYASSTASAVPLAANLDNTNGAELAINIADGKLFYKDSGGTVKVIAGTGGTGVVAGSNTQVQFNNNGVFGAAAGLTWDGTYLTANSIKDSALTSGRVTFAGASGLLSDAAGLTWDGTNLTANSIKDSALTSGRVTYAGTSGLLQDSANLTFDGTTLTTNSLTVSNAVTLSGGTANGVPYLNASKVLTSGSALTFDGTTAVVSSGSDGITVAKWINATGRLRLRPYVDATIGALFESLNTAENAYLPLSLYGSTIRLGNGAQVIIDSSGNLGLGVTPSAWGNGGNLVVGSITGSSQFFEVGSNWYFNAGFKYHSNGAAARYYQDAGAHAWFTAPSGTAGFPITFIQSMTLDASGRLLVGKTTSSGDGKLQAIGGNAYDGNFYAVASFKNTDSTAEKGVLFGYNNADTSGIIAPAYASGSGALAFWTQNGANWGERARITSAGDLLVRTASTPSSSSSGCSIENGAMRTSFGSYTGSGVHLYFINGNGTVGTISSSGSSTSYNTSSDYRLKDVTGPVTGAREFIMALQPKQGSWKADGSKFVGFLAHEFQKVSPSSVTGVKDAVDEEGNPIYQAMQASSPEVMANLVALLQEQQATIEALTARIAALEAPSHV